MDEILKYKEYTGSIEYSKDDDIFYGRVRDISSLLLYEGASIEELEKDFHETIDLYLKDCKEDGIQPEKPSKTMTTVTVELDDELVEKTKQILANYGLDLNTATVLFYSCVVNNGKLPFELNKIFQNEVKKCGSSKETDYLLSNPKNKKVLLKTINSKHASKKFSSEEWEKFIKNQDL